MAWSSYIIIQVGKTLFTNTRRVLSNNSYDFHNPYNKSISWTWPTYHAFHKKPFRHYSNPPVHKKQIMDDPWTKKRDVGPAFESWGWRPSTTLLGIVLIWWHFSISSHRVSEQEAMVTWRLVSLLYQNLAMKKWTILVRLQATQVNIVRYERIK